MGNKETICDLIEWSGSLVHENMTSSECEELLGLLKRIKTHAGAMEDRLLKYCNAIEDLGFKRNNRDYEGQ